MRYSTLMILAVLLMPAATVAEEEVLLPDVAPPDAFADANDKVAGTWWSLLWTDELTSPVLSADGSSVACAMRKGDKWAVMKDGKVYGGEYEWIGQILMSADGKSLAFQARKGRQFHVVWNGRESKPYTSCTSLVFSPTNGELAFLADVDNRFVLFRNGRAVYRKGYDAVGAPVYGPGGSIAFRACFKGREFVIRDGERVGGVFRRVTDPVFAPSGGMYFGAMNEDSLVMTREGSAVGYPIRHPDPKRNAADRFISVLASPVSESVAYTVRLGESSRLYRDGAPVGDGRSEAVYFIFVGNSLYYPCRNADAQWFVARDGVPVTQTYPTVDQLPSVNGTGKVAFVVRGINGKSAVYVNDKQLGEQYDAIRSVLVNDEGSVYYFAKTGKIWAPMKDGVRISEAGEYPYVTDFMKTGPRSIVFAATSGKEIVRKEISW